MPYVMNIPTITFHREILSDKGGAPCDTAIRLKTYTSCPQHLCIKHVKSSYLSSVTVRELGQTKDKHTMVGLLVFPAQMWQDPEYHLCLQSLPSQHDLQLVAPVITIATCSICHCLLPAI